jgi:hypothetical protein
MKTLFRLILNVAICFSLYLLISYLVDIWAPNMDFTPYSLLLLQYGAILGYCVFIVFVTIQQVDGLKKIGMYKPKLHTIIKMTYLAVALAFAVSGTIKYDLLLIVFLSVGFLVVTALFDTFKAKIVHMHEGNLLHPKKML